ncbi:(2Fe-2S)-binding protein [Ferviditalea candida]|uniref:(2Fe-2S)-binding protein n=1 Tax=Ferviditalea candida TaxID=3108399 RepID=A0ABU5ZFW6_9BACL|nr:(2Fe-2S)-binding protein [Paenibacillaceae bacterium T2]
MRITVTVNGREYESEVEPRTLLVYYLREHLELKGAHVGCDTTNCGACTVLLNGKPVKSCTVLAVQANGQQVMTVEGLEQDGVLHPVQQSFWEEHGLQCGYCTPGMLMSAYSLLEKKQDLTEEEIRKGISGNICRCTGYVNIVKAIQSAGRQMAEKKQLEQNQSEVIGSGN